MTRGFRLYLWGFRFHLVGAAALVALAGCGRSFFQFAEREPWRHEAEVQCLKSGAVKESPALVRVSPIDGPGICGAEFPLKVAALGGSSVLGFADDLRPPAAIPNVSPVAPPRWPVTQPRYAPAQTYPRAAPPPYDAPVYNAPPQAYPAPLAAQPYPPMPQTYPRAAPPPYNAPMYDAPPPYQSSAPLPSSGAAPGEPLSLKPPGIADLIEADTLGQPPGVAPPSYPPDRAAYPAYNAPPSYPRDRPAYAPPSYPRDRSIYPPATPVLLGPARGQVTGSAGPVEIKPAATLACPIVSALDQWIAEAVQPAALRWFGRPVTEIKQISAYSCRGMNGQSGAKISEHAFGNALDIAAFTLADGRKIVVRTAWNGAPEEQGFLRDIQGAACSQFTTVLAPGSNRFHYDHIHVDLMRRSSGRQICEPGAIPGEIAAARAAQRYARKGDPAVTGSIDTKQKSVADFALEDDDHGWMLDNVISSANRGKKLASDD